ncbi:MAG: glycosyltransferase family 2 protein [Clostridiales bacterium]|nr:glycosyltransferase family 2 protein [Clostridiales bacterium]
MTLQLLVSAMNADAKELAERMRIGSDAIIINQTDHFAFEEFSKGEYNIKCYSLKERGVGLSRNNALLRADHDISLFSDDDIVYTEGYENLVLQEFEKNPQADMILFNIDVCEERRTYHITEPGRVHQYNCGRYPTYSFAVRTEKLHAAGVTFSLLFGGGARYSNGEDSLFLRECISKGFRVFKVPVTIGREEAGGKSSWFSGYHEKFFHDRGVLYHFLYGKLAKPLAVRFLLAHKGVMCHEIPVKRAYGFMCDGIKEAKGL